MSEIDDLQGRLLAALDRIAVGTDALAGQAGEAAEAGLEEALEEERLANQQLKERLRTLNQKHFQEIERLQARLNDTVEVDALRSEVENQAATLTRLDSDIQRLRKANEQLRTSNAALRQANEAGVGEPHLINKAMLAELESLRASRAADAAEVATVLAKLEPMLEKADEKTEEPADA